METERVVVGIVKQRLELLSHGDLGGAVYFLYEEAKKFKDKDWALELGVGPGRSTEAILWGIKESNSNARLFSVDYKPCSDARERIKQLGLNCYHVFIREDDRNALKIIRGIQMFLGKGFSPAARFVFIDSSHEYEHTVTELFSYSWLTNQVFLHGTERVEVKAAIDLFLRCSKMNEWKYKERGWRHGFAILTRVKPLGEGVMIK